MAELLRRCMTKATDAEGDDVRHSLNWALSHRGILKVYSDRLECGDWTIAYSKLDEAVLFSTRQMFIPCYVLRVRSQGKIYQFGLNPSRFWAGELPFPARRESARLGYSRFSVALRIILVGSVLYWLWKRSS